jgi:hypothetical protein
MGRKYKVYWNIRRKLWSVQMKTLGGPWRVIGHFKSLYLRDCEFHVSEAGRQRVLRQRRKNVHAYVSGFSVPRPEELAGTVVSYNPYKGPCFVAEGGWPVHYAERVLFRHNGKLKANGIQASLPAANAA